MVFSVNGACLCISRCSSRLLSLLASCPKAKQINSILFVSERVIAFCLSKTTITFPVQNAYADYCTAVSYRDTHACVLTHANLFPIFKKTSTEDLRGTW